MRVLVLICVALCVVYIHGEDCPNNDVSMDCTHVQCQSDYHKECVKGVCTCSLNVDPDCVRKADCTAKGQDCNRFTGWHCVDNKCRCGGNFGK